MGPEKPEITGTVGAVSVSVPRPHLWEMFGGHQTSLAPTGRLRLVGSGGHLSPVHRRFHSSGPQP